MTVFQLCHIFNLIVALICIICGIIYSKINNKDIFQIMNDVNDEIEKLPQEVQPKVHNFINTVVENKLYGCIICFTFAIIPILNLFYLHSLLRNIEEIRKENKENK